MKISKRALGRVLQSFTLFRSGPPKSTTFWCEALPHQGGGPFDRSRFTSGLAFILILSLFCSGCSVSYVTKQALGQMRFFNRAVSVDEALQQSKLTHQQKEKLRLVTSVKRFAADHLGLKSQGQYLKVVYVNDAAVAYVLSASRPDRLEAVTWSFPVVGAVPYLGFFDAKDAKEEALNLQEQGYDIYLRPTLAYSTLGWFADPIYSPMLDLDEVSLIAAFFHELTHSTLYIPGEAQWNESLAEFIGNRAAIEFCREMYGATSAETERARRRWKETLEFSAALGGLTAQLEKLYAAEESLQETLVKRRELFKKFIERHRPQFLSTSYGRLFEDVSVVERWNNAFVISIWTYLRYIRIFEQVWLRRGVGLRQLIDEMRHHEEDLPAFLKRELQRLCGHDSQCKSAFPGLEGSLD